MTTRFALIALMIGTFGLSAGAAVRGGSVSISNNLHATVTGATNSQVPHAANAATPAASKAALIAAAQNQIVQAVSTGPAFLDNGELGSTSLAGRSSSMKRASWIEASIHANHDARADFSNDPKHYVVLVGPRLSPTTPVKAVVPLSFRSMQTHRLTKTRVITFATKANSEKGAGLLVANVQQVFMTGQWWIKSASVFFVPAGF